MNSRNIINKNLAETVLNIIIVLLTLAGTVLMFTYAPEEGALNASGIENFKFYTVLSNIFCGIVALVHTIFCLKGKYPKWMIPLKLAGVCGVTITFAVVAFFFGPLYGFLRFYKGGNLFFHLLEPVAAMIEFIVIRRSVIPFKYTVIAAVPTFIYGIGYLSNLLINGIGGPWPDTNDFYGFVSWGYPVGILIFMCITILAFLVACIFRKISNSRALQQ